MKDIFISKYETQKILDEYSTIARFKQVSNIYRIYHVIEILLGSGDLLPWVGVRRRQSSVVHRLSSSVRCARISSSQELLGQS